METKTFEKQLIYFDESEYRRQIRDFETNRDLLNLIAESYEEFFAGKISIERIDQIFAGSYQPLREAAILAISKSVKNQMLAEVAIERARERLDEFESEASQLVNRFNKTGERQIYATVTPLEWYSLNSEGRFYIPGETLARIKENCSNYISCLEEQGIRDRLQKLAGLINEVYESLGENLRAQLDTNFLPRHYNICEFLSTDEEGNTIPDPQTNYNILTQ